MSSLHNLLAEIGSILQNIIQLCIFIKLPSLANEKMFRKFFKIMRLSITNVIILTSFNILNFNIKYPGVVPSGLGAVKYG